MRSNATRHRIDGHDRHASAPRFPSRRPVPGRQEDPFARLLRHAALAVDPHTDRRLRRPHTRARPALPCVRRGLREAAQGAARAGHGGGSRRDLCGTASVGRQRADCDRRRARGRGAPLLRVRADGRAHACSTPARAEGHRRQRHVSVGLPASRPDSPRGRRRGRRADRPCLRLFRARRIQGGRPLSSRPARPWTSGTRTGTCW